MKKVVIVDDSPVILKTLSMKLTAAGYKALAAEDGGTAVSLVRNERPDLVILDISFPPDVGHGGGIPWDGFLILEWLRRLDEAKHIPFIIITGGSPEQYKHRALAAGAVKFFSKPLNHDELLETIAQVLEAQAVPSQPAA